MPFILKINTDDSEKFKEPFSTKRAAITRANVIMDAGTIIKATRHGPASTYIPNKVSITRMPRNKVVWERQPNTYEFDEAEALITKTHIFDGVEQERLLKIKDDKRMEEKRRWRIEQGLE